jgi:hypothetical protein
MELMDMATTAVAYREVGFIHPHSFSYFFELVSSIIEIIL